MQEATDRAIDSLPVGEPFRLLPVMQSVTLDVIMSAVFGIERGARQNELKRRIRAMIEPVASRAGLLLMLLSGGRIAPSGLRQFEQRRRAMDELIYAEIAARRDAPDLEDRSDVFSMMLLARDEDGAAMTDSELRDELVTLLVAGHETTATGLAWAFELLLRNPPVMERLRATLKEGDETYLDAVVKETLRLRPVVPGVGRVVRGEPFELGPLSDPGRHRDQSLDRRDPPAGRLLPGPAGVPPRALPWRRRPGHLHLAALRGRHTALPGGELRHLRDAGRDQAHARANGPPSC